MISGSWKSALVIWISLLISFTISIDVEDSEMIIDVDGPEAKITEQYQSMSDKSLLWGPYRSNLYMGITPRLPNTFLAGLLWHSMNDYSGISNTRHSCEQGDDLKSFGWERYDPRYGGRQVIEDNHAKFTLTFDFVKNESGNWALKIKGVPYKGYENSKIAMAFYAGVNIDDVLKYAGDFPHSGLVDGDVKLLGYSSSLGGSFDLDISDGKSEQKKSYKGQEVIDPTLDPYYSHYVSMKMPTETLWRAKEIYLTLMRESFEDISKKYEQVKHIPPEQVFALRDLHGFEGNLHFVQKQFTGSFEFDVTFNNEFSDDKITSDNIGELIEKSVSKFDEKFVSKFQLFAPFNQPRYIEFAKEIISQLMGGIGYFYGDQLVDREAVVDDLHFTSAKLNGKSEGPHKLFSAVPSRPFFPRGFYWDEGFHLMPILEFDSDLGLEIIKSWFNLIDDEGWIAREQILGDEARSKVPFEFTVQNPNIANPPTLMLTFTKILELASAIEKANSGSSMKYFEMDDFDELTAHDMDNELGDLHLKYPKLLIKYANEIYPELQKHYEWFRRTQKGELKMFDRTPFSMDEAYRWKGRTADHCLPSGIDDFPRCEPDVGELNVDLLSWMGVMTRSMKQIAFLLGKVEDSEKYSKTYDDIVKNLDSLHWSKKDNMYCDLTLDDDEEDEFECHLGYVTLLPFFNKLIDIKSTDTIRLVVESIKDPKKLWSDYGIRSLSMKDRYYGTGENYWRGPIWINMNYLALDALYYYGSELIQLEDPQNEELIKLIGITYEELRKNVVSNVYKQYEKSGFAWEQYNDKTGEGQRTRHFLGWTSLVVLMMKMPERII